MTRDDCYDGNCDVCHVRISIRDAANYGNYFLCNSCDGYYTLEELADELGCTVEELQDEEETEADKVNDEEVEENIENQDIDKIDRKFYRTVVQVEVLSEEPFETTNLNDIAYEITEGHCSGKVEIASTAEVSARRMRGLLIQQGSSPEFFELPERVEKKPARAPKCDKCGSKMFDNDAGEWDCDCNFGTKEMG